MNRAAVSRADEPDLTAPAVADGAVVAGGAPPPGTVGSGGAAATAGGAAVADGAVVAGGTLVAGGAAVAGGAVLAGGATVNGTVAAGGRGSAVPEPALAVLGAAAWLGEAMADGLADWSAGYARLADRGAARAARLLPAASATRRAGEPAVQLDWDVREAIDELQERGEEIVAYAELYRWRLLRRGRRLLTRPLVELADSALRGLAPITHPRRPADLGPLLPDPAEQPEDRPAARRAG